MYRTQAAGLDGRGASHLFVRASMLLPEKTSGVHAAPVARAMQGIDGNA